jgi:hypothetical protein
LALPTSTYATDLLKQSTAVTIQLGPFVDSTDGDTDESGLTIAQADVRLSKNGGNFAQKNESSSCTYDEIGYYSCDLNATDTNTLGRLHVAVHESGALHVWATFMVVPANVYDALVGGSDYLKTDVTEAEGTDYTTYTETRTLAAASYATAAALTTHDTDIKAAVGSISVGSAGINTIVDSVTVTTGTETNTYTSTIELDGTSHILTNVAGNTEFYYEFDIGSTGVPVNIIWDGYAQTAGDSYTVNAYYWGGATWEQIGTVDGSPGTTVEPHQWILTSGHGGTGANSGLVRIQFVSSDGVAIGTDRMFCGYAVVGSTVGYANGSMWYSDDGEAGAIAHKNAVADNPSNTIADIVTLKGLLNINRVEVAQGSTITFAQTMDNFAFNGIDYIIDLNGQQVDNTTIIGAVLTGTATGNGGSLLLQDCKIGTVSLPEVAVVHSAFAATVTMSEAGLYVFEDCFSVVAGSGAPGLVFSAGNQQVSVRHYSGGIEVKGMQSGDTMSLEGHGQLIINADCTGGTIVIRGHFKKTDNTNGLVTLDENANFQSGVIDFGHVRAATSNTVTLATTASAEPGAYDPGEIVIVNGTGKGQSRMIYQYDETTKIAVVDRNWKTNPDTTSEYRVFSNPGREHVNEGLAQGGGAQTIT